MSKTDYNLDDNQRIEISLVDSAGVEVEVSEILAILVEAFRGIAESETPPDELILAHQVASIIPDGEAVSIFAGMLLATLMESKDLGVEVTRTPLSLEDIESISERMALILDKRRREMASELVDLEDECKSRLVKIKRRIGEEDGSLGVYDQEGSGGDADDDGSPEEESS